MRVTLLLCDAAEEVGGKLYILGGGWSIIRVPDAPVPMALAILIVVPWNQANERHEFLAALFTEDGEQVEIQDQKVALGSQFEVGRPPGLKPGSDLNTPIALKFGGIALPVGGYRWEFSIDGTQMATAPFRVVGE